MNVTRKTVYLDLSCRIVQRILMTCISCNGYQVIFFFVKIGTNYEQKCAIVCPNSCIVVSRYSLVDQQFPQRNVRNSFFEGQLVYIF